MCTHVQYYIFIYTLYIYIYKYLHKWNHTIHVVLQIAFYAAVHILEISPGQLFKTIFALVHFKQCVVVNPWKSDGPRPQV